MSESEYIDALGFLARVRIYLDDKYPWSFDAHEIIHQKSVDVLDAIRACCRKPA